MQLQLIAKVYDKIVACNGSSEALFKLLKFLRLILFLILMNDNSGIKNQQSYENVELYERSKCIRHKQRKRSGESAK